MKTCRPLLPMLLAVTPAVFAADLLEELPLDEVWAGHPVGFQLTTQGDQQFAAYYDAERRMTVASRKLSDTAWQKVRLDETVGWDSHNYITFVIDSEGFIHLSGNMHVKPLVYFRTTKPRDITSFARVTAMVGDREKRCTYPRFFTGREGELYFTYRDGSSGQGDQLYNQWDFANQTWTRLIDGPLVSGEGQMNAYLDGPKLGPDGRWHLVWTWRDTPDCATNHDICYARSADLKHWETSSGQPLPLPITAATAEYVDRVPPGGGVINGNVRIGFDAADRPVVSYHKYVGEKGPLQAFNARRGTDGWELRQATNWTTRWEFSGGGSIGFEVSVRPVQVLDDGTLAQSLGNPKEAQSGLMRVDPVSLQVGEKVSLPSWTPAGVRNLRGNYPGLRVNIHGDTGEAGEADVRYFLRWETLGPNRDRPREEAPPASKLTVLKVRQTG